jgi:hypothetical protein
VVKDRREKRGSGVGNVSELDIDRRMRGPGGRKQCGKCAISREDVFFRHRLEVIPDTALQLWELATKFNRHVIWPSNQARQSWQRVVVTLIS